MSNKINLIWRSENSNNFVIGEILNSNHRYYFRYNPEKVKKAIEEGFSVLEGFPRVNSKYFSEEPFKLFTSWIGENNKDSELVFETLKGFTYGQFTFQEDIESSEVNNEEIA